MKYPDYIAETGKKNLSVDPSGDIGIPRMPNYIKLINFFAENWDYVIIVAGNHEHYSTYKHKLNIDENIIYMKQITSKFDNVHVLQNDKIDILGVRILGCTLWSHIPESKGSMIEFFMNDYRRIGVDNPVRLLTYQDTNKMHDTSVSFLEKEIEQAVHDEVPILIVTHHAPHSCGRNSQIKHAGPSEGYVSDLSHLIKKPVVAWVHGHTHHSHQTKIGDTFVIANCKGYNSEIHTGFDQNRVFSL